jgi:hypothetical protein
MTINPTTEEDNWTEPEQKNECCNPRQMPDSTKTLFLCPKQIQKQPRAVAGWTAAQRGWHRPLHFRFAAKFLVSSPAQMGATLSSIASARRAQQSVPVADGVMEFPRSKPVAPRCTQIEWSHIMWGAALCAQGRAAPTVLCSHCDVERGTPTAPCCAHTLVASC